MQTVSYGCETCKKTPDQQLCWTYDTKFFVALCDVSLVVESTFQKDYYAKYRGFLMKWQCNGREHPAGMTHFQLPFGCCQQETFKRDRFPLLWAPFVDKNRAAL